MDSTRGVNSLSIYSPIILNTELISKSTPVFLVFLRVAKQRVATSGSIDSLQTTYPMTNAEFNNICECHLVVHSSPSYHFTMFKNDLVCITRQHSVAEEEGGRLVSSGNPDDSR